MSLRSTARDRFVDRLVDGVVAGTVVRRHLARGSERPGRLLRSALPAALVREGGSGSPSGGAYARAVAALRAGELTAAEELARAAGPVGRPLAAYAAGERAVLSPAGTPAGARRPYAAPDPADPTSRPLRVLHLVTNALPEVTAGYTTRTHGIARAQVEAGLEVHVVTRLGFPVTKGRLGAARTVVLDGVTYHRLVAPLPLRPDTGLDRDTAATLAVVDAVRPDVLHAHTNHLNGQVALRVRERTGLPVVYEVRGFIEETRRSDARTPVPGVPHAPDGRGETYRLTRDAETWCMRHADAVVTISRAMAADIVGRGIDEAKVTLSPNAVGAAFLAVDRAAGADPLVTAALPTLAPGTCVVGVVGTLNAYEGVDVLLDALRLLGARPGAPAVHLLVVGDGPARADLEARAAGLPATFVGRVPAPEVPRWYTGIDLYCVPRADLPVTRLVPPLKPVEAMATGLPVVASDLPPLRELADAGPAPTGVLVPPGDAAALADALAGLAADAGRRADLGARARTLVAADRTWTAAADRYTSTYARLLHSQGAPA